MSRGAVAVTTKAMATLGVALAVAGATREAWPAEVTRVVSGSRGPGELFDFNVALAWLHEQRTATIKRELEGPGTGGQIALMNDLTYHHTRDTLALGADFGVYHDLSVFVSAPLVLADSRSLEFDRTDENSSTILRDGILPGFGQPMFGVDAPHSRGFVHGSDTVFQGPSRHGLEYLGLGARWAVFNQARSESKLTWLVRFEARLAVGGDQRFDPAHPDADHAVGPGYHQFVFSTLFSRRFESLEPWLGGWYMLPSAPEGSPYSRYVLGHGGYGNPQHRAGADFGVETTVWEDAPARQRIALELRGRLEARFFGLAQSELWEPLSGASTCPAQPATCRAGVDRDLTGDGVVDPNPGIVRSPSYGLLGADAGINVQVGRFVRFRALGGITYEQDRFLSDGRSGFDAYDLPGRRFRVEDGHDWHLSIDGGLLF